MAWSTLNKVGLALISVVAVVNFIPFPIGEDMAGPPLPVFITGIILGAIALIAVLRAWRTGSRKAAMVAVGVTLVNALLAVPAFFAPDVPTWLRELAGAFVALSLVGIVLTLVKNKAVA